MISIPPYESNLVHRSGQPNKSQWTISEKEEHQCFINSHVQGWRDGINSWGVFPVDNPDILGTDRNGGASVRVAKFVTAENVDLWHGYPVDTARKADIPTTNVLNAWLIAELFPRKQLRMLARQQRCTL